MTYVRFNTKPFEKSVNSFVDDLMTELPALFNTNGSGSTPVNIYEDEKAYKLEVIAPGFDKSDFKVNLDQGILTISAEKKNESKEESPKQVRREYSFRSFKRSFTVDDKIDASNIEAGYVNGVLTLNLPKKETVKASATEITIK